MPGFENLFVIRALVAPCYLEPSFTSSKVTEAVSGETVEIIDLNGDWLFIKQDDGYESWINFFMVLFKKRHSYQIIWLLNYLLFLLVPD